MTPADYLDLDSSLRQAHAAAGAAFALAQRLGVPAEVRDKAAAARDALGQAVDRVTIARAEARAYFQASGQVRVAGGAG